MAETKRLLATGRSFIVAFLEPRHFFEHVCPPTLGSPSEETGATICFEIEGAGAWTIDLGAADVTVGARTDVACRVRLTRSAFAGLVDGTLNVPAAIEDRSFACFGDPTLLERVAERIG